MASEATNDLLSTTAYVFDYSDAVHNESKRFVKALEPRLIDTNLHMERIGATAKSGIPSTYSTSDVITQLTSAVKHVKEAVGHATELKSNTAKLIEDREATLKSTSDDLVQKKAERGKDLAAQRAAIDEEHKQKVTELYTSHGLEAPVFTS